ncbi:hypothetical protein IKE72_02110 [Candidatus Saccharibacteria bacterium]|nr:hypothetical protein [Candidatus Saccharibacteria bacterium]
MEPETNTLTPDTTEKKRSNTPLYIIFGFLLAAIIALVIVIVVVNVNNKKDPVATEEDTEAKDESNNNGVRLTNPEGFKEGQEFEAMLSSLSDEARKLLDESTDNTGKVKELFEEAINKYQSPKPIGFVQWLIEKEVEILLSYGLTEQAYEIYDLASTYMPDYPATQFYVYRNALALATKENNQHWINVFQADIDATRPAFQADAEATERAQAAYDEKLQQLSEEDAKKTAEEKARIANRAEEE